MRPNPARMKVSIDNFHDAVLAIQQVGNNGKIGHNTRLVAMPDEGYGEGVGIKLHSTVIVAYYMDRIILNSGGYETVTTKARMNAVLPPWLRVFQHKNAWYVSVLHSPDPPDPPLMERERFQDGITITVDAQTYLPNPMKRPTAKHLRTAAGRRDWGEVEPQEAQAVWDRAMSKRPPRDLRAEFLAEASRKPLGPITHADYLEAIRAPLPGARMPIPKQYRGNPSSLDWYYRLPFRFYDDPDDVKWLKETHLDGVRGVIPFHSFVLRGNEDWPEVIELYRARDPLITDRPQIWFDVSEGEGGEPIYAWPPPEVLAQLFRATGGGR